MEENNGETIFLTLLHPHQEHMETAPNKSDFTSPSAIFAVPTGTEIRACWELCRLHNNIGFWVVWLPTGKAISSSCPHYLSSRLAISMVDFNGVQGAVGYFCLGGASSRYHLRTSLFWYRQSLLENALSLIQFCFFAGIKSLVGRLLKKKEQHIEFCRS